MLPAPDRVRARWTFVTAILVILLGIATAASILYFGLR
jgi:hypothetical protein